LGKIFVNWYKKAQNILEIPRDQYVKFDNEIFETLSEDQQEDYFSELRKKRNKWDDAIQRAMSTGQISGEEAMGLGYKDVSGAKISPLPQELFHITTAKSAVIQSSLKTRKELGQDMGRGLGGGTEDTISFTSDFNTAKSIYRALLEAKKVAEGVMDTSNMVGQAVRGSDAKKPWINDVKEYYKVKSDEDLDQFVTNLDGPYVIKNSYFPKTIEEFNEEEKEEEFKGKWKPLKRSKWEHGTRDDQYLQFIRMATEKEKKDRVFDFYKAWSAFREHAGGPMNPLFFLTDVMGLATVPDEEIGFLEFRPIPGALGYQVSSLGEWRTWSGQSVEFVRDLS
jgi:hypothetical protein